MEKELKEYGLTIRESDDPERQLVDFTIEDEEDNVATVWGDRFDDVEWECNHPYQCIEFGDDREEQGECLLCGAYCDYGVKEEWLDEGHNEDGKCIGKIIQTREPIEWYPRRDVGGMIGKYLKELKERA